MATSGTSYSNTVTPVSVGWYWEFSWTSSYSGNTATVNWSIYARATSGTSMSQNIANYGFSGNVNGTSLSHSGAFYKDQLMQSGSFTITGGNNFSFNLTAHPYSSNFTSWVSGTYTLDTAVRTPTVTCTITGKTSSSISVSSTVTDNGGAAILDNYVDVFSDSSCQNKVSGIGVASGTCTGLNANTTYYVRANASNGTYRGYSSVITVKTYAKTIPTISLSSKTSSSITVTSSCNVSVSSTQYRIKKGSGSYGNYQNSATFSNLSANTSYTIEVKKVASDSGESGTATLTVSTYNRTIPTISLSSKTVNSIIVTSGCNVSVSSTQYRIKQGSGSYGSYQNSATFSSLTPNTSYTIEVKKVGSDSGEAGTATLTVSTYDIGRLTGSNFNLGDNFNITVTNPSGQAIYFFIETLNGGAREDTVRFENTSAGTKTITLTDSELDKIYKKINTGTSTTIRLGIRTLENYYAWQDVTCTLTGNQKTGHVKVNGSWKRAKIWVKVNGSWKRAVLWVKENNTWKKTI